MSIDLHLHTTFSDGLLTPEQLVREALKRNLEAIAITDHDTIDGVPLALKEAKKYRNMEVIPGIELSTELDKQEIHILGYYIDFLDVELRKTLFQLQEKRKMRIIKIVNKLKSIGIEISIKEVEHAASGPSIGRPHVAKVLIEKGYVDTIEEAFKTYLSKGKLAYVPRAKLTPFNAIDIINKNRGIPVLAHPGLLNNQNIIKDLISYGIRGIEIYHKNHSPAQTTYFSQLALSNNLLLTGGSDCHGEKPLLLGSLDVPRKYYEELKKSRYMHTT